MASAKVFSIRRLPASLCMYGHSNNKATFSISDKYALVRWHILIAAQVQKSISTKPSLL